MKIDNFISVLDAFEKSFLWKSLVHILKEDRQMPYSFSFVARLISNTQSREPLNALLIQLGYASYSIIGRKLLSSLLLIHFYKECNTALLDELRERSRRLWRLLQLILENMKSNPKEQNSGCELVELKAEIDSYLLLFDQWKKEDLESLQQELCTEIDAAKRLGVSTANSAEWKEPLDAYVSILTRAKLSITPSGRRGFAEKEKDTIVSRAQILYQIIIDGPEAFISSRIPKKRTFVFNRYSNQHDDQNNENLVRLRSFHISILNNIKTALLDIVAIGEPSIRWPSPMAKNTPNGHINGPSVSSLIEADFPAVKTSLSLKELVAALRKTLTWLSFIISSVSSEEASVLAQENMQLSVSMDSFYEKQSFIHGPIDNEIVVERKSFLVVFYKTLEGLFQRTYQLALGQAVRNLIVPFISDISHVQTYFHKALVAAGFEHPKEAYSSLLLETLDTLSPKNMFILFDNEWITPLAQSISHWSVLMASFLVVKESSSISDEEFARYFSRDYGDPLDSWKEFLSRHSIDDTVLATMMNGDHVLVQLISRRIREAIVASGEKLFQLFWKKIVFPMHSGRALVKNSGNEWWPQWRQYISSLESFKGFSSLPIHSSLLSIPDNVLCERLIYPAALNAAKRTCFYSLLCPLS